MLKTVVSLYPKRVRNEFGPEIMATTRARREALSPGASGVTIVRFWLKECLGIIRGAHEAHRELATYRATARFGFRQFPRDLRVAFRGLRGRPFLFATSVVVLALGFGANGAMAGVGVSVLFGKIPVFEPERLVRVFHSDDLSFGVSLNELLYYREHASSMEDLAGWRILSATFRGAAEPVRVVAGQVTPNLFSVLGRQPDVGNTFSTGRFRREAVLAHQFWTRHFGADTSVIGDLAEFDEGAFEIVGVAPAGFRLLDAGVDFYYPVDLTTPRQSGRGGLFMDVIGRLGRDTAFQTAAAQMAHLAVNLRRADPRAYEAESEFGAHLVPLRDSIVAGHRPLLMAMIVGAGLVLLTTCLNVSTLLLSNVENRSHDIALRRALGASTGDVLRGYAAEGTIVAAAGALAGGFLAIWVSDVFANLVPLDVVRGAAGASGPVLATVMAATFSAGLLFAVAPLPVVARTARIGSNRHTRPQSSSIAVAILLVQSSIAVVLASSALLLFQTARNLARVDLGYRVDGVVTARVTLPASRYASSQLVHDFFMRLETQLEAESRVRAVGIVNALPLSGLGGGGDVYVEAISADSAIDVISQRLATPDYFAAMGIPLLAGRLFSENDRTGTPRVALVDEVFARNFFGSSDDAVGKRLRSFFGGEDWNTIVGVVGNVRHTSPRFDSDPHAYFPIAQRPTRGAHVVLNVDGDIRGTSDLIRRSVTTLDPTLAVYDIATMEERLRTTVVRNRFTLILFTGFAILALGLAVIGVYGTVRLAQERRAREMGIRRVLGATGLAVIGAVTQGVIITTTAGVFIGGVGSWGMGTVLENLLFGVSGHNMLIFGTATGLILLATIGAAFVPAFSALRTDMMVVLNSE